jgi:hypothetical protein
MVLQKRILFFNFHEQNQHFPTHFQSPERRRTSEVSSNWNHREPEGSTTCPCSASSLPYSSIILVSANNFIKFTHFNPVYFQVVSM